MEKYMQDEIIAFLRENQGGVQSKDLAEKFLKFRNADARLAHIAVNGIIGRDRRCMCDGNGMWHAVKMQSDTTAALNAADWAAVYLLADPDKTRRRILHVSVWTDLTQPHPAFCSWLTDPAVLPHEERIELAEDDDESGGAERTGNMDAGGVNAGKTAYDPEEIYPHLMAALDKKLPVFLSSSQYSLLSGRCAMAGFGLTDDYVTATEFMKAVEMPIPHPLTLETLSDALMIHEGSAVSARKKGKRFASCIGMLLDILKERGIESRNDLDKCDEAAVRPRFAGKNFTYEQVLELPETPGVYAFKNKEDRFIYIGKAKNLKRRLMTYFRETDESPGKLEQLRNEAHNLVTHRCGSELESLLLEYRLIKKHSPVLNTRVEIGERKGTFAPINDCIVLLPHAEKDKGMSFWFRRNQKITMKPFDVVFSDTAGLIEELRLFFFNDKLTPEQSDFPEQEIVYRWVRSNQQNLVIVPVSRMGDSGEVLDAMKSYWKDVSR